ncbi:MAG: hypothetical protein ABSH44_05395 [Bryobacteraceae bacterium]|jgi:hypothetical protein
MNILRWHRSIVVAAVLAASAGCLSAGVTLTLTPSPDLFGSPGSIVGWGFTIVNDTSYYIEFSSSQFCDPPIILSPAVSCTSPSTGAFSDIIVGNDPIIGPDSSLSENFDPIGFTTGIGYFSIGPDTPYLSSDVGQIVLIYDVYGGYPTPDTEALFSQPLAADASVTTVTPEPATAGLAATVLPGLVVMGLLAARRRRSHAR